MKHTPAPWVLKRNRVTISVIASSTGDYITENVRAQPNQEANARLIAAAPELLDELYAARRVYAVIAAAENHPITKASLIRVDQLIAKIQGAE